MGRSVECWGESPAENKWQSFRHTQWKRSFRLRKNIRRKDWEHQDKRVPEVFRATKFERQNVKKKLFQTVRENVVKEKFLDPTSVSAFIHYEGVEEAETNIPELGLSSESKRKANESKSTQTSSIISRSTRQNHIFCLLHTGPQTMCRRSQCKKICLQELVGQKR